ncbi:MAG: VWA domain-containing protein [Planctomycetota bacterium]|nr:VWA domain-containing protein [Planctomycetota bacterium]MDA1164155.1 VWA domain-containing protein [Planctomycetota bacterium]
MNVTSQVSAFKRGSILVLSAVFMVLVLGMAAFTVDFGYYLVQKTRLRAAVDAATLAAIDALTDDEAAMNQAITDLLTANGYDTTSSDIVVTSEYGNWDIATNIFTPGINFGTADSVRVHVVDNGIPAFFGPIFDEDGYSVSAEAVSTLSSTVPRDIVVVIDCSTSMVANMSNGQTRMDNTKAAATTMVNEMLPDDRVGLAVFSWYDNSRNRYQKTGRPETELNFDKTDTLNRIDDLEEGFYTSGTNIAGGLRAGLDVILNDPFPRPPPEPLEPEAEQIIVLMTDGQSNLAEPYPTPDDGPTGTLPPPPYAKKPTLSNNTSITKWANTVKARGIKLHVVTLGASAYSSTMVNAASPDEDDVTYYHHVSEGGSDAENLLEVFRTIGIGNHGPKLVK